MVQYIDDIIINIVPVLSRIYPHSLTQWSFGVTCWEVFSGGTIPYGGIGPLALVQLLCDGERLSKPSNSACTDEM